MVERKVLSKVVVLGNMGVGKTTLLDAFLGEQSNKQKATTGADFRKKEVKLGNKTVTLQCWDTAGQEQFNSLGFAFYRGSNACILCFDLTDVKSFEQLTKWKKDFLDHANPTDPGKFPFVIVGNKTDLADRKVPNDAARAWCQANGGYPYFETCATKNEGVSAVFVKVSELTSEMSNSMDLGMPLSMNAASGALKLDANVEASAAANQQEKKKKGCGC